MLGDLAPGGEVGMPVGVAELLRGLPGDVDLDVLLALRERGIEPAFCRSVSRSCPARRMLRIP